ncbi:hypothetical protein V8B97DRAFT_2002537 [Scleroderma yunnanense]
MDSIIHQYVNIPDDPAPVCERPPPLPPMDDDVDSLRAIPEPDGERGERANVLILRTDIDGQTLPLGLSDPRMQYDTARHLKRAHHGIEFLPQPAYSIGLDFDLAPDLSPDSSPLSVVSSTLMTPETGVLRTEVETPALVGTYFEDQVFGNDSAGYVSADLGELEDSLSCDAIGYLFPHAMLEDIACQSSDMLSPIASPHIPIPEPATSFLVDPRETLILPSSAQTGILATEDLDYHTLGSLRRSRPSTPVLMQCSLPSSPGPTDNQVHSLAIIPSPVCHSRSLGCFGGKSGEEEDLESLVDIPVTADLSTSRCLLGKRCRLSPPGDDAPIEGPSRRSKVTSEDDDEYTPTRQARHKEARSPSTLSGSRLPSMRLNTGHPKTKRRAKARRSRPYTSSSSTPRSRCQHCKSTFSRTGDVERHQRSLACPVLRRKAEADGTLDEAKFTCPICGDKLSRNDSQARHFDNTHPDIDPADYGLKLRKRDGRPSSC